MGVRERGGVRDGDRLRRWRCALAGVGVALVIGLALLPVTVGRAAPEQPQGLSPLDPAGRVLPPDEQRELLDQRNLNRGGAALSSAPPPSAAGPPAPLDATSGRRFRTATLLFLVIVVGVIIALGVRLAWRKSAVVRERRTVMREDTLDEVERLWRTYVARRRK